MMQPTPPPPAPSGPAFSCLHAGPVADWRRFELDHPVLGRVPGKLFLQQPLGLSGLEISLSLVAPGRGIPFLHRHRRNEEVYLFLSGRGQFQVDGRCFDVGEGSVVRVAPEGARAFRNTGDAPLAFLVVQAPAGSGATAAFEDGERVDAALSWPEA